MKTVKKFIACSLVFLMTFCMLTPAINGASVRADNKITSELPFALISDIHYYPESFMGNYNDAWNEYISMSAKEYEESDTHPEYRYFLKSILMVVKFKWMMVIGLL